MANRNHFSDTGRSTDTGRPTNTGRPTDWHEQVCEQGKGQLAFTLVELLVVVSILGLLAAFVIPTILGRLDDTPTEVDAASGQRLEETIRAHEDPLPGLPPLIERADIKVQLTPTERRRGTTIYSLFEAKYHGTFVLRATDVSKPVRLSIPLPLGAEEAEDVTLTLMGAGYTGPADLRQVRIGIDGLHWSGPIPREGFTDPLGAPFVATVTFTAKGKDQFALSLPEASGIRSLQVKLDLASEIALPIPTNSLQPKTVVRNDAGGYSYAWNYTNLVSQRPIIVDLPATESPLARVMFMLRLIGLALLLFGCGFWYLVEGYEAGRLADFRWHHFLLLGLNYSLFFAVFVVCGFHDVDTVTSLWVSAVTALPLLVWHTARIVDWRFAAKYTLPLVALTIGIVWNGVYGGEWKSFVFVGAAAFVIAYLTLSIEGLIKRQEARSKSLELVISTRMQEMEQLVQSLAGTISEASSLDGRSSHTSLTELKEAMRPDLEAGQVLIEQFEILDRVRLGLPQKKGLDRNEGRRTIAQGLFGFEEAITERKRRLTLATNNLRTAVEALEASEKQEQLEAADKQKRRQAQQAAKTQVHCMACGHGWTGSRHCPQCGARRPEELSCSDCETVLPLPVHLMSKEGEPQLLHCPCCGKAHGRDTHWFLSS